MQDLLNNESWFDGAGSDTSREPSQLSERVWFAFADDDTSLEDLTRVAPHDMELLLRGRVGASPSGPVSEQPNKYLR